MQHARPNDRSSDPDAVMSAAGPTTRRPDDVSTVNADAPGQDGPGLSPMAPERMHRAEDDARAQATSPDFSEHPAHVVTGAVPAQQAGLDAGADVAARTATTKAPAGGGAAGDR